VHYFIIILCSLAIMFSVGCNIKKNLPVCEKEGHSYCTTKGAFRDKWYDYYETGQSCMKGECYQQAIWAFEMAIKKRAKDERMARAYGMHLLDYFPHRELGIIYFLMNDYPSALKELNRSIQSEPSAKAIYYLDKVRTHLLLAKQDKISPPQITVHEFEKSDDLWTNADPVIISGTANDDAFIKKIVISGRSIFMEGAQKRFSFEEPLNLSEGTHELLVMAENLPGKKIKRELILHVDRTGPVIMVQKIVPEKTLEGIIFDDSGCIALFVDSKVISIPVGKKVPFDLPWNGKKTLLLLARDKAGNQTKALIHMDQISAMDPSVCRWLASNNTNQCLISKPKVPEIIIDHFLKNNIVYSDKVTISGHVFSQTKILSVKINKNAFIHEKGHRIFFSKTIPLKIGENQIIIDAIDQRGQLFTKEMILTRKQKEVFKRKYRMGIKLYPFELLEQTSETNVFYSQLLRALHKKNRFRTFVSDNFHDFNIQIDQDMNHPQSGVYFLKGIIYSNPRGGIEIVGRVFDSQSRLIDYVDVYEEFEHTIPLRDQLHYLANRMSEKFHRAFPLVSGIVTQVSESGYTISPQRWYHGKGSLRLGSPFILFRLEAPEIKSLSETIILGTSQIKQLKLHDFDIHAINDTITTGDQVITQ